MFFEVSLGGVPLEAEIALEGLIPSVRSQVDQVIRLALVLLVAVFVVAPELPGPLSLSTSVGRNWTLTYRGQPLAARRLLLLTVLSLKIIWSFQQSRVFWRMMEVRESPLTKETLLLVPPLLIGPHQVVNRLTLVL